MAKELSKRDKKRAELREHLWPNEDAWTSQGEVGFFQAPRSLILILYHVLGKHLRAKPDVARVYLELWARHWGQGVIEMVHAAEHAFFAGYVGSRAVRTWRERMQILEKLGFIKINRIGEHFKSVLLIHPTTILHNLHAAKKIEPDVWKAFEERRLETKEPSYDQRMKTKKLMKIEEGE